MFLKFLNRDVETGWIFEIWGEGKETDLLIIKISRGGAELSGRGVWQRLGHRHVARSIQGAEETQKRNVLWAVLYGNVCCTHKFTVYCRAARGTNVSSMASTSDVYHFVGEILWILINSFNQDYLLVFHTVCCEFYMSHTRESNQKLRQWA